MKREVWKKSRIGQIGQIISGGTPSTEISSYWNGTIPFVTPDDLSRSKSAYLDTTTRTITIWGLNNSSANLLPADTIIISTRAPIGYIALSESECVTNQGCKSVVLNKEEIPLFHYYNIHKYVEMMKRLGVGTTFSEISKKDLEKIEIFYPESLTEQSRIASILSSCDDTIRTTQAVIDKYKAIKQGMMRDLFTRGLAADGTLRPSYEQQPELYKPSELGMIPKDWDVKTLDSVGIIVSGGTPSTEVKDYWDGIIPFITPYDLSFCINKFINKTERKITKEGFRNSSGNLLPKGSLVISTRAPIGYMAINQEESVTNQGCKSIIFNQNQHVIFHYYNLQNYIDVLKRYGSGTTFMEISKKDLERIKVCCPNSDENGCKEQQAVADRLSAIDAAISSEEALLAKYQAVKQGLMDRLLTPPADAVIEDETEGAHV